MAAASHGVVRQKTELSPTALVGANLQRAYDFFNKELFAGRLPQCIILLHRKKGAHGYFWAERFGDKTEALKLDEIALNPTTMRGRDETAVLSTLVHEMCHLEQQHFGKPPKSAYHNKEWAAMMKAVGLVPSVTGLPGGAETGPKCTHYIEKGGVFEAACAKLLAKGLTLPYSERRFTEKEAGRAAAKRASKTKYLCPDCDMAVWGKSGLNVMCGDCGEQMEEE